MDKRNEIKSGGSKTVSWFKKRILWLVFTVYYLNWSRLYTFFQILFYGKKEYLAVKAHYKNTFKNIREDSRRPSAQWNSLMELFPKLQWRSDKWYMAFDVISDPYLALNAKGDDCDGFARIATEFFDSNEIKLHSNPSQGNSTVLKPKGIWFCYPNNLKRGHAIAVWENGELNLHFIISNRHCYVFPSRKALWAWFEQKFFKVTFVAEVTTPDLKLKRIREVS